MADVQLDFVAHAVNIMAVGLEPRRLTPEAGATAGELRRRLANNCCLLYAFLQFIGSAPILLLFLLCVICYVPATALNCLLCTLLQTLHSSWACKMAKSRGCSGAPRTAWCALVATCSSQDLCSHNSPRSMPLHCRSSLSGGSWSHRRWTGSTQRWDVYLGWIHKGLHAVTCHTGC